MATATVKLPAKSVLCRAGKNIPAYWPVALGHDYLCSEQMRCSACPCQLHISAAASKLLSHRAVLH